MPLRARQIQIELRPEDVGQVADARVVILDHRIDVVHVEHVESL
jgi:hypothetical protein